MALLQNGYRHNLIGNLFGGTSLDGANPSVHVYRWHRTAAQRNILGGLSDSKAALPNGNLAPSAWVMPRKAGGMSSRDASITVSPSGSGLLGLPATGSASITFTVSDLDGQLIVSGSGTSLIAFSTNTPLLTASINGAGSASFAVTGDGSALGALAGMVGETSLTFSSTASILPEDDASPLRTAAASFSFSGSLASYALGHMEGSTVDTSQLTPAQIAATVWGSVATEFNDAGTMGNKLNTASSGGVDLEALAEAVWSAESAEDVLEILSSVQDTTVFLQKVVKNKRSITSDKKLIVYDDDNTTPIIDKQLLDKDGNQITDLISGVLAQEGRSNV